jgi:hypothetical protein
MASVPTFDLDMQALQDEVLQVAQQLVEHHPTVGALVMECTNLAPYSPALRESMELPVFDVLDLARLLHGVACGRGSVKAAGMI